jgi:hypothetical protein
VAFDRAGAVAQGQARDDGIEVLQETGGERLQGGDLVIAGCSAWRRRVRSG